MLKLHNGMILYHGSYCEVSAPQLDRCAAYKDFGKGFYLTSAKEQAENFVRISLKKAKINQLVPKSQNYGLVSAFEYHPDTAIMEHLFQQADADWLHYVVGHRKRNTFQDVVMNMRKYDVIGGKIADDATNFTIITYLAGAYGTLGSEEADALCISRLIPERLNDQYCFRTNAALQCLTFVESEQVCID